ncbi:YbjQ family protein [Aliikangiella sp. IMCC44359]|uniref:YbjQ family protein n=1 Tax=Aliikangiella sp. IMCC44359 TaxID=3459125 RepID=UPI00403A9A7B
MVSTANYIPAYSIEKNFGVVKSIQVRSRSIVGNFFGSIQMMFGGDISIYAELCERTRQDAFDDVCLKASNLGANAVISLLYETNEIMDGLTEVLCYGTAVHAKPEEND